MSEFKIAGCCTLCDDHCFEVVTTWDAHERYPGEPKRLGAVIGDATLVSFMLLDGSRADLTFCAGCAESLASPQYVDIWRKVCRSWRREMQVSGAPVPDWYYQQYNNGILSEMGRELWRNRNG